MILYNHNGNTFFTFPQGFMEMWTLMYAVMSYLPNYISSQYSQKPSFGAFATHAV